jgi:hypothetical protein
MISRNHVFAGTFAFLCTLLGAMAPTAVRAADDDVQVLIPVTAEQSRQAQAAQAGATKTVPLSNQAIVPARYNGDVRHLPRIKYPKYHLNNEFASPPVHRPVSTANAALSAPAAPTLSAPMPATSHNFAGLGFLDDVNGDFAGAGWPPDTNGDVGPTYYIQSVNDSYAIFDKKTGSLVAAFTENQLWSGAATGTPCDADNFGDPVVVHDAVADRWVLTNFAFAYDSNIGPVAPFYQCVAVSQSNDPVAGGWYLYAVQMDTGAPGAPPANTLVDYPKFGIWTDCLYMGGNGFDAVSGGYAGPVFAAFDRAALYSGAALDSANSSLGFTADNTVFSSFPANLNGDAPPPGTSEYFVAESQVAYSFDVRKFQAGATACGAGSTLSAAANVSQASYGYPVVKKAGSYTVDMVKQPVVGVRLDSLGDRIMQRVVYRNLGGSESLWVVHTTCGPTADANGACQNASKTTQPQWAQINVTGGTINTTPVQQQIYAPDTTIYRWMGSLAVDRQGNMAVGYSRSSGAAPNYPSIAYSGRLVGDPANQLTQTEVQLAAGASSQDDCTLGGLNPGCTGVTRWGDYSSMTVDPLDDCTFWYTSEYYPQATNTGEWQTRIASFRFPGCTGPAAQLVFTIEPNAAYLANGTITVDVSVEDAAGNVVITDSSAITLALQNGTVGAVLSGTNPVNAVNGVATFNVSVDLLGTGYTLNATDAALTPADSTAFDVVAGGPASISFSAGPADAIAGASNNAPTGIVVHVQDALGSPVVGDAVTLAVASGPGALTVTNGQLTDVNGDATFTDAVLTAAGSYTLSATEATASLTTTSGTIVISPAAATLVFTTQPTDVVQGGTLNAISVTKQDAFGNVYSTDTDQVDFTVSACSGFALGSANLDGSTGTATLSSPQQFYSVAIGLQVTASDAAATLNVLSSAFAVTTNADLLFANGFESCTP